MFLCSGVLLNKSNATVLYRGKKRQDKDMTFKYSNLPTLTWIWILESWNHEGWKQKQLRKQSLPHHCLQV